MLSGNPLGGDATRLLTVMRDGSLLLLPFRKK